MPIRNRLIFSALCGSLLAAGLAAASPGDFWRGWLVGAVLLVPGVYALAASWRWGGGGRALGWMVALAFLLRLGLGTAVSLLLPVYGHDSEVERAGYLFYDAYRRDSEAWDAAQSMTALSDPFNAVYDTDQYRGMIVLSVLVYHYLSPDAHRMLLIVAAGAFAAAMGVAFFWKAVRARWGGRLALLAAWTLVLYPDGIFFSAAAMREPFLLGLICLAVWAALTWREHPRGAALAAGLSLGLMLLFSTLIAAATLTVLAVWFYFDALYPRARFWRLAGLAALLVSVAALLILRGDWLVNAAWYDLRLTVLASGRVEAAIEELGQRWRTPFLVVYGLAQPVLPAAIAYPTTWLWRVLGIWRAAGWYALAPFLVYAAFAAWKPARAEPRRLWLWLAAAVLVWLVIASARAGGDQWDNPRYRTLFLPWMALLAAGGLDWALVRRDPWLGRWLAVEGIFLLFFTDWYLSRYYQIHARLQFTHMLALIAGLSALVLAGGWAWDRWKSKKTTPQR